MGSSYYITYGGNRLTFPGATGSVAWEYVPPPVRRYEYTLWKSPDYSGHVSGTLPSALSAFDEVVVGLGWQDGFNLHGVEYKTYNFTGASQYIARTFSNGSNYFWFGVLLSSNTTSWKVTSTYNSSQSVGMLLTPISTTAKWTTNNNAGRYKSIYELVGVKYQ